MTRARDCVSKAVARGVRPDRAEAMREHAVAGGTADQLKERAKLEAARAEKRAEVNLARRVTASMHIQNAPDPLSGLQSLLVGTNKAFEGSRLSAESAILGYRSALISGFARDLGDNWKLFASRKLEREWVLELAELNAKQGGNPGRTGSRQALEIAESVKKLQDAARDAQNRHGADIQQLDRYIARTEHAPEVLEKMGKEGWKKLVYNTADLARTFGPERPFAEIDEALDIMYDRLRLGRFHDFEAEEDRFVVATQNVAKKASESRVLQFSDPEKWYAYSRQASLSTVTERVLNDALKAARNAGMMSVLGTNPEDNWARIFAGALERAPDLDTRKKLEGAEDTLKEWLKLMTGQSSATKISRKGVALAVQNWLTLQRTAKLGFLPFSQLADLATVMSELRYQGVDLPSRIFGPMAGYFRGKGSQQREVAQLVGGAIEGWISEINQRMDVNAHLDIADPQARGGRFTGALAKTQNFMFTVTGATAMTNRAREASVYLMARYFGGKRGIAFERLNAGERRIMSAYNIGKPEWEALNSAEWTNVQGDLFMTPHVVQAIPAERLNAWKEAAGHPKWDDETAREQLAMRLWRYFSDRERYAVLNIGVQEKAILTQGKAPDTAIGIAIRLMAQFKSFIAASMVRTAGREIYGQSGMDRISGIVQFAGAATVMGTVAEMLRQIAKNEDPTASFYENPGSYLVKGASRGGALSVMGDFLFGEFSRHGQRPTGWLVGPTGGTVDDLISIWAQGTRGENVGQSALYAARNNLPLQNLFWTKAAFDAFVWAEIMEWANPGYTSRMKRRQRREGIEPILGR